MSTPKCQCQVCGKKEAPEVLQAMLERGYDFWLVHHIERVGGVIPVLACPACSVLTQDLILQSYMERIRHGLIPGFH